MAQAGAAQAGDMAPVALSCGAPDVLGWWTRRGETLQCSYVFLSSSPASFLFVSSKFLFVASKFENSQTQSENKQRTQPRRTCIEHPHSRDMHMCSHKRHEREYRVLLINCIECAPRNHFFHQLYCVCMNISRRLRASNNKFNKYSGLLAAFAPSIMQNF